MTKKQSPGGAYKKSVLNKILQDSKENTKNYDSCEFCEILLNIFSLEHLWLTGF